VAYKGYFTDGSVFDVQRKNFVWIESSNKAGQKIPYFKEEVGFFSPCSLGLQVMVEAQFLVERYLF
jgi:hypothetical protein